MTTLGTFGGLPNGTSPTGSTTAGGGLYSPQYYANLSGKAPNPYANTGIVTTKPTNPYAIQLSGGTGFGALTGGKYYDPTLGFAPQQFSSPATTNSFGGYVAATPNQYYQQQLGAWNNYVNSFKANPYGVTSYGSFNPATSGASNFTSLRNGGGMTGTFGSQGQYYGTSAALQKAISSLPNLNQGATPQTGYVPVSSYTDASGQKIWVVPQAYGLNEGSQFITPQMAQGAGNLLYSFGGNGTTPGSSSGYYLFGADPTSYLNSKAGQLASAGGSYQPGVSGKDITLNAAVGIMTALSPLAGPFMAAAAPALLGGEGVGAAVDAGLGAYTGASSALAGGLGSAVGGAAGSVLSGTGSTIGDIAGSAVGTGIGTTAGAGASALGDVIGGAAGGALDSSAAASDAGMLSNLADVGNISGGVAGDAASAATSTAPDVTGAQNFIAQNGITSPTQPALSGAGGTGTSNIATAPSADFGDPVASSTANPGVMGPNQSPISFGGAEPTAAQNLSASIPYNGPDPLADTSYLSGLDTSQVTPGADALASSGTNAPNVATGGGGLLSQIQGALGLNNTSTAGLVGAGVKAAIGALGGSGGSNVAGSTGTGGAGTSALGGVISGGLGLLNPAKGFTYNGPGVPDANNAAMISANQQGAQGVMDTFNALNHNNFTMDTMNLDTQLRNQGIYPTPTYDPSKPVSYNNQPGAYEQAMMRLKSSQNQLTAANEGEAAALGLTAASNLFKNQLSANQTAFPEAEALWNAKAGATAAQNQNIGNILGPLLSYGLQIPTGQTSGTNFDSWLQSLFG